MATDERQSGCENTYCAEDAEVETAEGWMCPECAGVLDDGPEGSQ